MLDTLLTLYTCNSLLYYISVVRVKSNNDSMIKVSIYGYSRNDLVCNRYMYSTVQYSWLVAMTEILKNC